MDVTSRTDTRNRRPPPAAPAFPAASSGARAAQAYCGPAHGCLWTVDVAHPAATITLHHTRGEGAATETLRYRLARDPRTGRPVRNLSGRYVYVLARHDPRT